MESERRYELGSEGGGEGMGGRGVGEGGRKEMDIEDGGVE